MPDSADEAVGELALNQIDGSGLMQPSTLSPREQQAMRDAFEQSVARLTVADVPRHHLEFRKSGIGPNAFALPGGTIVLTDELYRRMDGDRDILVGVLGHELGHLRHRHGMRMLVQATLIGTAAAAAWGDFSTVLAAAPTLLGQSGYARDFERDADADAIALLRANGISPAVMVELFERLAAARAPRDAAAADQRFDLGIALASHPPDAERMRSFRAAAGL